MLECDVIVNPFDDAYQAKPKLLIIDDSYFIQSEYMSRAENSWRERS